MNMFPKHTQGLDATIKTNDLILVKKNISVFALLLNESVKYHTLPNDLFVFTHKKLTKSNVLSVNHTSGPKPVINWITVLPWISTWALTHISAKNGGAKWKEGA